MSALNGWMDWLLFVLALSLLLYAGLLLLNLLVLVFRGVGISSGLFLGKIIWIVLIGLVGYWLLSQPLGVL